MMQLQQCSNPARHTTRKRGNASCKAAKLSVLPPSCTSQSQCPAITQEPGFRALCLPLARREILAASIVGLAFSSASQALANTSAPISSQGEAFEDDEYTLFAPGGFVYTDIAIPRKEVGPAPERSPLRVRFDAQEGGASLSVVVKIANQLKTTFTQVGDITAFGGPEQAANLLLPRGAVLLNYSKQVILMQPRVTKLGEVQVPPRTYYRYEFNAPNGEHVFISAAAARGKVYVCGGSATPDKWNQPSIGPPIVKGVKSFRLKEATPEM